MGCFAAVRASACPILILPGVECRAVRPPGLPPPLLSPSALPILILPAPFFIFHFSFFTFHYGQRPSFSCIPFVNYTA